MREYLQRNLLQPVQSHSLIRDAFSLDLSLGLQQLSLPLLSLVQSNVRIDDAVCALQFALNRHYGADHVVEAFDEQLGRLMSNEKRKMRVQNHVDVRDDLSKHCHCQRRCNE